MHDPTRADESRPDAEAPPAALLAGTVLGGRFRVGALLEQGPGWALLEGRDRQIDERPVVLLDLQGAAGAARAREWVPDAPARMLPLLDRVALPGREVLVFLRPAEARPLLEARDLSREQRAWLLVALAEALEEDGAGRWELVSAPRILCGRAGQSVRLHLLPVPAGTPGRAHRAAQARALCRLVALALFGIREEAAGSAVLAQVPESLADLLRPWLSEGEKEGGGPTPPLPAADLARALGMGAAAARLPVLAAPDPPQPAGPADAYPRRKKRVQRRGWMESLGALGGLALLGVLLLPLVLAAPERRAASERGEAREAPAEEATRAGTSSPRAAIPRPALRTRPPEVHRLPAESGIGMAAVLDLGLIPEPVSPVGRAERESEAHVLIFPDADGRVGRIEHYAPGGRLDRFDTWRYDLQDRPVARLRYDSTGHLRERWRIYPEARELQRLDASGRPLDGPCILRYALDEEGRFTLLTCVDDSGEPGAFLEGHRSEAMTYIRLHDGLTRVRTRLDASGAPTEDAGGVSSIEETWDERGLLRERRTLDREGRPVAAAPWGAARTLWRHARQGSVRIHLQDAREQTTSGWAGWNELQIVRREGGALARILLDGSPAAMSRRADLIPLRTFDADERGFPAGERFLDETGRPMVDPDGVHRIERIHDDHGQVLRICHHGIGEPIRSPRLGHAHCELREQDERGRLIGLRWYDRDGQPRASTPDQVWGEGREYDDADRLMRRMLFDRDGRLAAGALGRAGVAYEYDAQSRLIEERWLDVWGRPARGPRGVAGVRYRHDAWGRWISACFFAPDRSPARLSEGAGRGAACIERGFEDELLRWIRWLDPEGEPLRTDLGSPWTRAARVELRHDRYGRLVEQLLLDEDEETSLGARDCTGPMLCVAETGVGPWRPPRHDLELPGLSDPPDRDPPGLFDRD